MLRVKENLKFDHSFDSFRALCIVFVVISHSVVAPQVGHYDLFRYIFHDATSWFLFIAGYLFYLTESSRFNYRQYLLKKIKYVLLPYLIFNTVFIGIALSQGRSDAMHMSSLAYIAWSFLVGGAQLSPLWFIPMIFLIYLLSQIFLKLSQYRVFFSFFVLSSSLPNPGNPHEH